MTSYVHPLDDPRFNPASQKPVWYLAHPLASDDKYTFQQNMDHTLHMMKLCFEEGFRVIAPWHTLVLAWGGQPEPPDQRVIAMETDLYVAKFLGRIILAGHKISRGMQAELAAVRSNVPSGYSYELQVKLGYVIDLTRMQDADARLKLMEIRG